MNRTRIPLYRILVVVLVVSAGGLAAGCADDTKQDAPIADQAEPQNVQIIQKPQTPRSDVPEGWSSFDDSEKRIGFYYPADLITVTTHDDRIQLRHAIAHTYINPCDFRNDPRKLTELVDFDVTVARIPMPLRDAIRRFEVGFQEEELLDEFGRSMQPGLIDTVTIGEFLGYRINVGAEGCGHKNYYLSAGSGETLLIERKKITEFNTNILMNAEEFLALGGIIKPEDETRIFYQIASSLRTPDE